MAPKKKASEVVAPPPDLAIEEAPPAQNSSTKDDFDGPFDPNEQRIRILPGSSPTAASFEFKNEDHTLGNALRYMVMKNPDVEFCGYSIPHPSEALMNIRIQTYGDTTAEEALDKGLADLMALCDVVADTFILARQALGDRMET